MMKVLNTDIATEFQYHNKTYWCRLCIHAPSHYINETSAGFSKTQESTITTLKPYNFAYHLISVLISSITNPTSYIRPRELP